MGATDLVGRFGGGMGMNARYKIGYNGAANQLPSGEILDIPHDITHSSGDQYAPPNPHPPEELSSVYYYGDSSDCGDHEVVWANDCSGNGSQDQGFRCGNNRVVNPLLPGGQHKALIGPFKGMCAWMNQPHVNWNASLALFSDKW